MFERLGEFSGSSAVTLRVDLLRVRHTEGRLSASRLLFCRSRLSNLRRNEDAFEVIDPVAEWLERFVEETDP